MTRDALNPPPAAPSFLLGGGQTGELIRTLDWASTPIGPLERWPQSLRTLTAMLVVSPVPMALLWGEAGTLIYNDGYARVAGARHPHLLGASVFEGWPEIREFNENVMRVGLSGETLSFRDQVLTLYRNDRAEQVWLNLDYSPAYDEVGTPAGVIAVVVETTERVRAELRLQAERERMNRLFEQAPGLMAMLSGPDHVFEMANPAYHQLVGDRPLLGLALRDALPEVERQGFLAILDNVYRAGEAYVSTAAVELRRGGPNGAEEQRVVDFVFQPVTDVDGRVEGIFIQGYDVTERVEAEGRLQFLDSLGKFTSGLTAADSILEITTQRLGEHLNLAVCAYADMDPDQDGFTIRGNWAKPGAAGIVGHYSLRDFGSLAVEKLHAGLPLILSDTRAQLPSEAAAAFLSIGLAATICLPLVKNGRLTALMAIHDDQPRAWLPTDLALLNEVTERSWAHIERVRAEAESRLAEQRFREALEQQVAERTAALAQSEAHIRAIAETTHMHQGLLTPEGITLYCNATSLAAIHASAEQVVGLPYWDSPWFSETSGMPDTIRAAIERAKSGYTENITMRLALPTGLRSFDFSMRPVFDADGTVVAIVPEAVETTARKQAEQALQQSQKMEALGNLTGGIAHDFNNLLMAVLGSLELLARRMPDDPGLLRLVNNAKAGAERGAALTSRMLSFARKQELRTENVDLRLLVADMTELLERSLGAMVTIETRFPERLALVETDPNQLETALLNLAVNARDAMNGTGHIVIEARETYLTEQEAGLPAGSYVCLTVTDTGEGMDEATLKRAMEPFFTTKGVGKGTGLGLSMVHGFAEQSRGRLTLESTPGQGTVASIWLPALGIAAEFKPRAAQAPATPDALIGPLTVLAVDDDHLVLMNTADMLRDQDHQVLMARSAREALVLLKHIRVDAVVTDHAMPQMTGLQLAEEIDRTYPGLPVVIASGYAEITSDPNSRFVRLAKPFSQSELNRALARSISPIAPH